MLRVFLALGTFIALAAPLLVAAAPAITNFTPTSGPIATSVTINGSGFGATPAANTVKFGTITATVTTASATQLRATVPPASLTNRIKVTVAGATATSAANFVVVPTIASFSPASAPVGASVTIQGTGYSSTVASNQVRFNGQTATVTTASPTQLAATVPASATNGPIRVTVGGQSATSTANFTVALSITGFTPANGVVGTTVRIQGKAFSTTPGNNVVKFNGVEAPVEAATATQLTVVAPFGAVSGPVSVTVAGQTATSAASFGVVPDLSNFNAAVSHGAWGGVVGTIVEIRGTGFHPTASSNLVTFNGVGAVVTSAAPDIITTSVPAGASTGPIRVTVGGHADTLDPFLVYKPTAIDGPTLSAASTRGGDSIGFSFNANPAESMGVGIDTLVVSPPGPVRVFVDGRQPWELVECTGYCAISPTTALLSGGVHGIRIVPVNAAATMQATLTLSSTLTGSLVKGNPPSNLDLSRPGRSAVLTFGAAAQEDLKLTVGAFATQSNRSLKRQLAIPPAAPDVIDLPPGSPSVVDLVRRPGSTSYQLTLTTTDGTTGAVPVSLALQPVTLTITEVKPSVVALGDAAELQISISPKPPASIPPTGDVVVSHADGSVACTIALPSTSCSMVVSPKSNYLAAAYRGDANYGTAVSPPTGVQIASHLMVVRIEAVSDEPSTPDDGASVVVSAQWHDVRFPPNGGTVIVTDGINTCSSTTNNGFGSSVWGQCVLRSPPGTYTLKAYYSGDNGNGSHPAGIARPISHVVSSPGGVVSRPAGTEVCGVDPEAGYPASQTFQPVERLPGTVWSRGLDASIHGSGPLSAAVTWPLDGTTVSASTVDVVGRFNGPANTGITVNGIVGRTSGDRFLVPNVPLAPGANSLTLNATTLTGTTFATTVTVSRSGTSPVSFELTSFHGETALGGSDQYFAIKTDGLPVGVTVSSMAIDFDGDGSDDYSGTSAPEGPPTWRYSAPGLYRAQLRLHASNGQTYEAVQYLLNEDFIEQRSVVCDVFGYLRSRIGVGDSAGAVLAYHQSVRPKYQAAFDALGSRLATTAPRLGYIVSGNLGLGMASLTLVRDNANQTRNGFPLELTRGSDGVWRISAM